MTCVQARREHTPRADTGGSEMHTYKNEKCLCCCDRKATCLPFLLDFLESHARKRVLRRKAHTSWQSRGSRAPASSFSHARAPGVLPAPGCAPAPPCPCAPRQACARCAQTPPAGRPPCRQTGAARGGAPCHPARPPAAAGPAITQARYNKARASERVWRTAHAPPRRSSAPLSLSQNLSVMRCSARPLGRGAALGALQVRPCLAAEPLGLFRDSAQLKGGTPQNWTSRPGRLRLQVPCGPQCTLQGFMHMQQVAGGMVPGHSTWACGTEVQDPSRQMVMHVKRFSLMGGIRQKWCGCVFSSSGSSG